MPVTPRTVPASAPIRLRRRVVVGLLTAAGLTATRVEDHSDALAELIGRIQARLKLARALIESGAQLDTDAVERGLVLAARAAVAVSQGALGYCLVVAQQDR